MTSPRMSVVILRIVNRLQSSGIKSEFQFRRTAFNSTKEKDYFINDGSFGDDVAIWLMNQLRSQGLSTSDKPGQEDFGWYFTFHVSDVEHCVVFSFQPNDPAIGNRWLGWVERQVGFVGSILGGRKRGILPEAVNAVETALRSSPDIQDVSWEEDST